MSLKVIRLLLLAFVLGFPSPEALKAAEAQGALVLSVNPQVVSTIDGQQTPLAVKMTVPVKAVLVSDAGGWAQLIFPDASTISIAPDSELELADFVDNATEQNVVLNLAAGTTRVVTGDVSRRNPGAFTVNTPQASVGIRGTIVSISVRGETTSVYLTETTGQGVEVTDRVTGGRMNMTTTGNVLEIGPGGMHERPATSDEARSNNVAARGLSAGPASVVAGLNTTPGGALAPGGAFDIPSLKKDEISIFTPLPAPTPPAPILDVTRISGIFTASGSATRTRAISSWTASFQVNNTAISGGLLNLDGRRYAENGSGSVASDASFSIGGFSPVAGAVVPDGGSTSMSGQFSSLNGGSLTILNPDIGLNTSGSFGGLDASRISGSFEAGLSVFSDNYSVGFDVSGMSISNAYVDRNGSAYASSGTGSVTSDARFSVAGFSDAPAPGSGGDTMSMSGQFTSPEGGSVQLSQEMPDHTFIILGSGALNKLP